MLKIQPLHQKNYPQVKSIYQQGINTGNATFETKAPVWEAFQKKFMLPHCIVGKMDGEIVAWAGLSLVSARKVYAVIQ